MFRRNFGAWPAADRGSWHDMWVGGVQLLNHSMEREYRSVLICTTPQGGLPDPIAWSAARGHTATHGKGYNAKGSA